MSRDHRFPSHPH